jgi:hypothetical protein
VLERHKTSYVLSHQKRSEKVKDSFTDIESAK